MNLQPLDWLTVEGFKSIESVQKLRMQRINVMVGANGSGKSNLIKVFSFLEAMRAGRLRECVARAGGADRLLHFGAKTTNTLNIGVSFGDEANQYKIALAPNDLDQLAPLEEVVCFWDRDQYDRPQSEVLQPTGAEAGISRDTYTGIVKCIQRCLGSWRLYHFHDTGSKSPFRTTCALHDNRFLRPDGSNLAAVLYMLRETHEESYGLIRRTVRLVVPFFDDFVLEPTTVDEDLIRLEWRHIGTDAYFDASSLSDGTLRFIALATLLLQPDEMLPSVILLDEPELGLHPYAVTMFCSLVRAASVRVQVIAATQSPLILDHFEPAHVLVAERRNGASTFTRLEAGGLETWLNDFSLGQLWEKNELGGRPRTEHDKPSSTTV